MSLECLQPQDDPTVAYQELKGVVGRIGPERPIGYVTDFMGEHSDSAKKGVAVMVMSGSIAAGTINFAPSAGAATLFGDRVAAVQTVDLKTMFDNQPAGHETLHEDPPAAVAAPAPAREAAPAVEAKPSAADLAVMVKGDSYGDGLKQYISTITAKGYQTVNIDSACGRHIESSGYSSCARANVTSLMDIVNAPSFEADAKAHNTHIYIIGTNDHDFPKYSPDIAHVVQRSHQANPDAHVYVVNLYTAAADYSKQNDELNQLAGQYDFTVIDYAGHHGPYDPNQIHPKDYSVFAQDIADGIGAPTASAVKASVAPAPEVPAHAEAPTPPPAAVAPAVAAPAASGRGHRVRAGETLTTIAAEEGTSVDAIAADNPTIIHNKDHIKADWILAIPGQASSNDPMDRMLDMIQTNGIKDRNKIYAGQVLQVPDGQGGHVPYTVKNGDSLYKLAENNAAFFPSGVASSETVVIQPGDSISHELAQRDLAQSPENIKLIQAANPGLRNPNHVMPGDHIVFPGTLKTTKGGLFKPAASATVTTPPPEAIKAPEQPHLDLSKPEDQELLKQYLAAVDAAQHQPPAPTDADGLRGNTNEEKISNFFRDKGLTPEQVAGILGNIQSESGFEPRKVQYGSRNSRGQISTPPAPGTPDDQRTDIDSTPPAGAQTGYGIVQFTPAEKVVGPAQAAGKSPDDLGFQLDLLWQQLNTNEKPALDAVLRTNKPRDAALAFETKYERHLGSPQPVRGDFAEAAMAVPYTPPQAPAPPNPPADTGKDAPKDGDNQGADNKGDNPTPADPPHQLPADPKDWTDKDRELVDEYVKKTKEGQVLGGYLQDLKESEETDSQKQAQEIVQNPNVQYTNPQPKQQMEAIAEGHDPNSCGVGQMDPAVLNAIGKVAKDHTLAISSMVRPGDPCGTGPGTGSPHARETAVDIASFDGKPLDGSNQASKDLVNNVIKVTPPTQPLGFGVGNTKGPLVTGDGRGNVTFFQDHPDHVHVDGRRHYNATIYK